jgi:hypothetical protein
MNNGGGASADPKKSPAQPSTSMQAKKPLKAHHQPQLSQPELSQVKLQQFINPATSS